MTEKKPSCLINGLSLVPPLTGVGRVSLELCRRLFGSTGGEPVGRPLYYYGYYSRRLMDEGPHEKQGKGRSWQAELASVVRRAPLLKRVVRKSLHLLGRFVSKDMDLYWEPNHTVLEQLKARRVLVTVHDLSCMLYPEWHPKERLDFFNAFFLKGLQRADRIVTVSNTVRQEILEHLKLPEDRVACIHNGVDGDLFKPLEEEAIAHLRAEKGLPERYVLCVGSLEPRKNLLRLFEAWGRLSPSLTKECPLLLIGDSGWKNEDILRAIGAARGTVRWLGYVPCQELPLYYSAAELFVYPSLYEGFGLPPVEAMACGTPVLVSDIPVHREICGSAASYVSPYDVGAMAETLRLLLSNPRRSAAFLEYSWDHAASRYAEEMKNLL